MLAKSRDLSPFVPFYKLAGKRGLTHSGEEGDGNEKSKLLGQLESSILKEPEEGIQCNTRTTKMIKKRVEFNHCK